MGLLVYLPVFASIAGLTLLFIFSVLFREVLKPSGGSTEAQCHCREEATRLLNSGAPDEKIEEWLVAADCPVTAMKKRSDALPGYGLKF